jgi:hypothetical protein
LPSSWLPKKVEVEVKVEVQVEVWMETSDGPCDELRRERCGKRWPKLSSKPCVKRCNTLWPTLCNKLSNKLCDVL